MQHQPVNHQPPYEGPPDEPLSKEKLATLVGTGIVVLLFVVWVTDFRLGFWSKQTPPVRPAQASTARHGPPATPQPTGPDLAKPTAKTPTRQRPKVGLPGGPKGPAPGQKVVGTLGPKTKATVPTPAKAPMLPQTTPRGTYKPNTAGAVLAEIKKNKVQKPTDAQALKNFVAKTTATKPPSGRSMEAFLAKERQALAKLPSPFIPGVPMVSVEYHMFPSGFSPKGKPDSRQRFSWRCQEVMNYAYKTGDKTQKCWRDPWSGYFYLLKRKQERPISPVLPPKLTPPSWHTPIQGVPYDRVVVFRECEKKHLATASHAFGWQPPGAAKVNRVPAIGGFRSLGLGNTRQRYQTMKRRERILKAMGHNRPMALVWPKFYVVRKTNYFYSGGKLVAFRSPYSGKWINARTLIPLNNNDSYVVDWAVPRNPYFPKRLVQGVGVGPVVKTYAIPGVAAETYVAGQCVVANYAWSNGAEAFRDPRTKKWFRLQDAPAYRDWSRRHPAVKEFRTAFSRDNPRPDGPFFGPHSANLQAIDQAIAKLHEQVVYSSSGGPRGYRRIELGSNYWAPQTILEAENLSPWQAYTPALKQ